MSHKIRFVLFLVIAAGGTLFLARQWRLYHSVPKGFEWAAADQFLRSRAAPEDMLLFEPEWLAGFAQDHRRLGGYSVMTQREILKRVFPPSSRLWLISLSPNPSLESRLQKEGFQPGESSAVYSIGVRSYQTPLGNNVYSFTGHLAEASIFIDYGEGKIAKAGWENNAWVFSENPLDWNQVSVRLEPFRNQVRRCIWLHPLEAGFKTISFSNVPLGRAIRFAGGITDSGLKTPPGAPVILHVRIGGERIETLEFKDTDMSFGRLINTQKFSGTNRGVDFEVQTSEQGQRHFCFSAWSES